MLKTPSLPAQQLLARQPDPSVLAKGILAVPVSNNNLVICTLRYSDNLGDGVIGDCLEYLIKEVMPDANISHLDMAGRSGYSQLASKSKGARKKSLLYLCPRFLRRPAFWLIFHLFIRNRLIKLCSKHINGHTSLLIFGGGQVLNDVALNFPLKFQEVCRFTHSRGVPTAVNAAGVSENWSWLGRREFAKAFKSSMDFVSVRDNESKATLDSYIATRNQVQVTFDPAIWAKETYKVDSETSYSPRFRLGLGIANPKELATQASGNEFHEPAFQSFWLDLVDGVDTSKYDVVLFTNGSSEDDAYLSKFSDRFRSLRPHINFSVEPRPLCPEELVSSIASMDVIVAHRLHANIVAYSLGIPTLSLVWDRKVSSFNEMVGRSHWCYAGLDVGTLVSQQIDSAREAGVDLASQGRFKRACLQQVQTMLERARN
ncbi:MAG: polysaccharide pyruvyl transferase family protein [Luteimonas sp.]